MDEAKNRFQPSIPFNRFNKMHMLHWTKKLMLFVSFSRNFGQLKIMSFLCVLGHLKRSDYLEIQFPFNKLIYRKGFGFFFCSIAAAPPKTTNWIDCAPNWRDHKSNGKCDCAKLFKRHAQTIRMHHFAVASISQLKWK